MKPICLIGRYGKETKKEIINEKDYLGKDFQFLTQLILNKYQISILKSEWTSNNGSKIELTFYYIDKDGNEKQIGPSNYISSYYVESDGRFYWKYKICERPFQKENDIAKDIFNIGKPPNSLKTVLEESDIFKYIERKHDLLKLFYKYNVTYNIKKVADIIKNYVSNTAATYKSIWCLPKNIGKLNNEGNCSSKE